MRPADCKTSFEMQLMVLQGNPCSHTQHCIVQGHNGTAVYQRQISVQKILSLVQQIYECKDCPCKPLTGPLAEQKT
uniref:Uncharacterized protein n=1 Tax=Arundo donax TaxID=35708 RepID=A0A0A9D0Y5_ARUDO